MHSEDAWIPDRSYLMRMSSALNGSSALQHFKPGNTVEIRNGIMFDFYLGLPQMVLLLIQLSSMPPGPQHVLISNFLPYFRNSLVAQWLCPHLKANVPVILKPLHCLCMKNNNNNGEFITCQHHWLSRSTMSTQNIVSFIISTSQVLPLTNIPIFLSSLSPCLLSSPFLPSLPPCFFPSSLSSLLASLPSLPPSLPPSPPPFLLSLPPPLLHFSEIEQWIYKVDGLVWQVLWRVRATKRRLSRSWIYRNLPVCIVSCGQLM